ncbi:hypothetical protein LWP59_16555 [Amycolatopsis acidiphila]|nr:hypothetical protein [Amycolatopsis acidiphila]UIJ63123.1 hypothetical protein LWP59_16555 [Amycolatopsis acidiphila]
MHEVGVAAGRVGVQHRRQRLDVHLDELGGVFGQITRVRDDDRDRIADEPDIARGQAGAWCVGRVRACHRPPGFADQPVELRRGVDGTHPFGAARLPGVDGGDPAARHRAAHERGVQHARHDDVLDEPATTAEQAGSSRRWTD